MLESDIELFRKKYLMKKSDRIFIAGHNGLVGSSVVKIFKDLGFKNLILVDKKKLDLRNFEK